MTTENTVNIFEKATRMDLQFPVKGSANTSDIWKLSIKNLDSLYQSLTSQLEVKTGRSLLATRSNENEELNLQIAIVEHIFNVKKAEADARDNAAAAKARDQKILSIIERKEDAALENLSIDELKALRSGGKV